MLHTYLNIAQCLWGKSKIIENKVGPWYHQLLAMASIPHQRYRLDASGGLALALWMHARALSDGGLIPMEVGHQPDPD